MPQATRLFTFTSWLLNAALLLCVGVLGMMLLALGALVLDEMGIFLIPIPPAFTQDMGMGTVLAVSALVLTAGAICTALSALILMLIGRIVRSATAGDPFVAKNAMRLNAVGALLLVLQGVGLVTNIAIDTLPPTISRHLQLGFGVSLSGLFAALLVFVLAQIFQRGSEMRAELEGTI